MICVRYPHTLHRLFLSAPKTTSTHRSRIMSEPLQPRLVNYQTWAHSARPIRSLPHNAQADNKLFVTNRGTMPMDDDRSHFDYVRGQGRVNRSFFSVARGGCKEGFGRQQKANTSISSAVAAADTVHAAGVRDSFGEPAAMKGTARAAVKILGDGIYSSSVMQGALLDTNNNTALAAATNSEKVSPNTTLKGTQAAMTQTDSPVSTKNNISLVSHPLPLYATNFACLVSLSRPRNTVPLDTQSRISSLNTGTTSAVVPLGATTYTAPVHSMSAAEAEALRQAILAQLHLNDVDKENVTGMENNLYCEAVAHGQAKWGGLREKSYSAETRILRSNNDLGQPADNEENQISNDSFESVKFIQGNRMAGIMSGSGRFGGSRSGIIFRRSRGGATLRGARGGAEFRQGRDGARLGRERGGGFMSDASGTVEVREREGEYRIAGGTGLSTGASGMDEQGFSGFEQGTSGLNTHGWLMIGQGMSGSSGQGMSGSSGQGMSGSNGQWLMSGSSVQRMSGLGGQRVEGLRRLSGSATHEATSSDEGASGGNAQKHFVSVEQLDLTESQRGTKRGTEGSRAHPQQKKRKPVDARSPSNDPSVAPAARSVPAVDGVPTVVAAKDEPTVPCVGIVTEKINAPTGPAVKAAVALRMDRGSELMLEFYRHNREPAERLAVKRDLRDKLLNIIRGRYPECGLYMIGSTLSGFGSSASDMDLCLMLAGNQNIRQRFEAPEILKTLRKMLFKYKFLSDIEVIPAKVPILKLRDNKSGVCCDLNVNNSVGIRNTHLLSAYSSLDTRVAPLAVYVKHWASVQSINNASEGTLSSYSLTLMLLHYLQCGCSQPVLPSLQVLYPERFNSGHDITTLTHTPPLPPYASPNSQSIAQLFTGFLHYFRSFQFQTHGMSVRLGRLVPAHELRMSEEVRTPNRYTASTQWKYICIEEPFTRANAAYSVYDESNLRRIQYALSRSHATLVGTGDVRAVVRRQFTIGDLTTVRF